MKYLIFIIFIYSSLIAQDLSEKRNYISLQIGEPSSIRFQHSFKKSPKLNLGIGMGMLGLIYQPDYARKFSIDRGYWFVDRSDIFVLDVFIRRNFPIGLKQTLGFLVELGFHNRITPEMGFDRIQTLVWMGTPNFFFWEPIPYCQLGGFVRLGSRRQFELNIQYGLGVNVLFVPGYLEQIGSVGLGYRFEISKRKKE